MANAKFSLRRRLRSGCEVLKVLIGPLELSCDPACQGGVPAKGNCCLTHRRSLTAPKYGGYIVGKCGYSKNCWRGPFPMCRSRSMRGSPKIRIKRSGNPTPMTNRASSLCWNLSSKNEPGSVCRSRCMMNSGGIRRQSWSRTLLRRSRQGRSYGLGFTNTAHRPRSCNWGRGTGTSMVRSVDAERGSLAPLKSERVRQSMIPSRVFRYFLGRNENVVGFEEP